MRGHRFVRTGLFDPATLSGLQEYHRPNYNGAPWADATGLGRTATSGGADPTNGTAVNGYTPAQFTAASNKFLTGQTLSTVMSSSAFSGWALVNVTSIAVTGLVLPANGNDMIACSGGTGVWGLIFNGTGPTVTHHVLNGSGTDFGATTSFSTGAWQLIQWSFDATNVSIRVNGGSRVNTACASIFSLTSTMKIGQNVSNNHWLDGPMLEFGLRNVATLDAEFDQIRTYCNAKYGISV